VDARSVATSPMTAGRSDEDGMSVSMSLRAMGRRPVSDESEAGLFPGTAGA
jgi:hypothetical protein